MVYCEASICADSLCRCIRMFYMGFFSQNKHKYYEDISPNVLQGWLNDT